jgi:hypothetical protein
LLSCQSLQIVQLLSFGEFYQRIAAFPSFWATDQITKTLAPTKDVQHNVHPFVQLTNFLRRLRQLKMSSTTCHLWGGANFCVGAGRSANVAHRRLQVHPVGAY